MKKILDFIPLLIMVIVMIMLFANYDIAHMETDIILEGSSEYPFWIRVLLIGLFLGAMLCLPVVCLVFDDERVLAFLYCFIILFGIIIGKDIFCELLLLGFCFIGILFGSAVEISVWIIRLFFPGFNGMWIGVIAQVVGHILTVCALCCLQEAFETSKDSGSASKGSCPPNYRKGFDYNEELREMREKQQLETLQRIERDLRYK